MAGGSIRALAGCGHLSHNHAREEPNRWAVTNVVAQMIFLSLMAFARRVSPLLSIQWMLQPQVTKSRANASDGRCNDSGLHH